MSESNPTNESQELDPVQQSADYLKGFIEKGGYAAEIAHLNLQKAMLWKTQLPQPESDPSKMRMMDHHIASLQKIKLERLDSINGRLMDIVLEEGAPARDINDEVEDHVLRLEDPHEVRARLKTTITTT